MSIAHRKTDHIALCATEDVGFRGVSPLFSDVVLVHQALPELDAVSIDTSITMFGKTLRAPLVIAAMTGGTSDAERINRELASIAEERGIAFGVGSQRAMHVSAGAAASYRVRDVAPNALVFGNIGVVQARTMSTADVARLVESIDADALCIHLNPAMEMVQPEGDRDFRGCLAAIERIVKALEKPVIVKETGCGISYEVAVQLKSIGVRYVDVSGAGGTSWVGVETMRARASGDRASESTGEALWDWGIPTAASLAMVARCDFDAVIATGGVATGVDVAKAISLGGAAAGVARPVLKALVSGGREEATRLVEQIERELRMVMLLTASGSIRDLQRAKKVIRGELRAWIGE